LLKVTFKNVGPGDSIIIEWDDDLGEKQIGIVDCCKYNNSNPVLLHLNLYDYKKISFIVLSHAHTDHYSGFMEVLEYCEIRGIIIDKFLHTILPSQLFILRRFDSVGDLVKLNYLLEKIDALHESEHIIKPENIYDSLQHIELNTQFKLGFLSPNYPDYKKLIKEENKVLQQGKKTRPDTNVTASVIKIYSDKWNILLTSDAPYDNLVRVAEKDETIYSKRVQLVQIPHHGSDKGFQPQFWSPFNRMPNTPAVFSVGISSSKNPKYSVVRAIADLGYEIYSTNCVNGIKEYLGTSTDSDPISDLSVLDFEPNSYLIEEISIDCDEKYYGDKVCKIENDILEFV